MDTRDDAEERRDGAANDPDADAVDRSNGGRAVGTTEPVRSDSDARDDPDAPDRADEDRRELGPLEPGTPNLENAFFVLLGALATVVLLAAAI